MPRFPLARRVPILILAQAAMALRDHWNLLEAKERKELARLLKESKGRPGALSKKEREELRRIVGKLDVLTLGKRVAGFGGRRRR
ncbi:MAG TPA: hypothetical protein VFT42_07040 [Solirubrobacteraceae bacterium]|nr:hypothetical protein [Solirubrobacteraceae bacterium]